MLALNFRLGAGGGEERGLDTRNPWNRVETGRGGGLGLRV